MSQPTKELISLKRASLDLAEQRGFDISSEIVLRNKDYDDPEVFKNLYMNLLPAEKDRYVVKFFEKEKINPMFQFRTYMSTYYPSKENPNNPADGCVVFFASTNDNKKVSKEDVAYFCRMIEFFGVNNGIIISKNELHQSIDEFIDECIPCKVGKVSGGSYGCFIQHYMDQELKFNPLNHVLVPKHRILSQEEIEQLNFKKDKFKLPNISALDPIAKRLGARIDDIIEISRKSLISKTTVITEEEISYRVVKAPVKMKKK